MPDVLAESATVVIVGAGVAGMTTAVMLRRCDIDCVVLERQSRDYVEQRQRAGVLEYRAAQMTQPEPAGRGARPRIAAPASCSPRPLGNVIGSPGAANTTRGSTWP